MLEIDGIDDAWSFNGVQFRSVALNSAGNWQGATETRHCNFICSYGADNCNLTALTPLTDESIMVAGGVVKNIDFELDGISPSDGKLVLELQLYKGTNNNGCFYGLTGIVLKGNLDGTTAVCRSKMNTAESNHLVTLGGVLIYKPALSQVRQGVLFNFIKIQIISSGYCALAPPMSFGLVRAQTRFEMQQSKASYARLPHWG